MPSVKKSQTDFSRGETSPNISGRTDIEVLYRGLKYSNNFIPKVTGGIVRREGTSYLSSATGPNVRWVRYFSETDTYALLFEPYTLSVYKGRALVVSGISTTLSGDDIRDIDYSQTSDYMILTCDRFMKKLTRLSDTSWSIEDYETEDGPYLDENEGDTQLTVSTISDIAYLYDSSGSFVVGDVGKYVEFTVDDQPAVAKILSYIDANTVTVEVVNNVLTEPDKQAKFLYSSPNLTVTNSIAVFDRYTVGRYVWIDTNTWYLITAFNDVTSVAATLLTTMIAGSLIDADTRLYDRQILVSVTSSSSLFGDSSTGDGIRLRFGYDIVYGKITEKVSDTEVRVSVEQSIPRSVLDGSRLYNDGKTKKFRLGAWSDFYGYPQVVAFFRDKAFFYGSDFLPNTFWTTESNKDSKFSPTGLDSTVSDTNAVTYKFNSNKENLPRFIIGGKLLFIGTNHGIWQISPSYVTDVLTPENTRGTIEDSFGAAKIKPLYLDSAIIYVQKYSRKIRELFFDFNNQSYVSTDLTILAEHIFKDEKIVGIDYQSEPNTIIWCYTDAGNLYSMTYNRKQQKSAWARHDLGGDVLDLVSIPNEDKGRDDIYFVVDRNGSLSVEVMTEETLLDSAGYSTSGLSRFDGQEVWAILDGEVYQKVAVSSGVISVPSHTTIQVGLYNEAKFTPHPPEVPINNFASSQGMLKRIQELVVKVKDSLVFHVVDKDGKVVEVVGDKKFATDGSSFVVTPESRDYKVNISTQMEYSPEISIELRQPTMLEVLATTIDIILEDEKR